MHIQGAAQLFLNMLFRNAATYFSNSWHSQWQQAFQLGKHDAWCILLVKASASGTSAGTRCQHNQDTAHPGLCCCVQAWEKSAIMSIAGISCTDPEKPDDAAPCSEDLQDSQVDAALNLLLSHLAAQHHVRSLLCSSARHFILSRRLVESLAGASPADTPQLLAGVKQAAARLDRGINGANLSLNPGGSNCTCQDQYDD